MKKGKKKLTLYLAALFLAAVLTAMILIMITGQGKQAVSDRRDDILLEETDAGDDSSEASLLLPEKIDSERVKWDAGNITPEDCISAEPPSYEGEYAVSISPPVPVVSAEDKWKEEAFSGTYEEESETPSEPYDCGEPLHSCAGPEDHLFITSLEEKGCPYCASRSCRSFYSADEFGNISYRPELCPSYREADDPAVFCRYCGKRSGNGQSGTCARFINDMECPFCGKAVNASECHTCRK